MAEFKTAFDKTMANEGGFVLHEVPGDTGGQTYAGISRNNWPDWPGWDLIDAGEGWGETPETLSGLVASFYKREFWDPLMCDQIQSQELAGSLYDIAVNTGLRTASKMIQRLVSVKADGIIGSISLGAINQRWTEVGQLLVLELTIEKLKRYADICNGNRSQDKFLLGWLNRTLKEV